MNYNYFRIIIYSLISLPMAALYFPIFIYLANFYAVDFSFSLGLIGIIFLLIRLLDAFTDPLMGYLSDQVKSFRGGRKIWFLVSLPLIMFGCWKLFVPDESMDVNTSYFVIYLFVLTIGWTIMWTPYYAMGAELSNRYVEKSYITLIRESFAILGIIISGILYSVADSNSQAFYFIALFVVITLPITVLMCFFFVKEEKETKKGKFESFNFSEIFGAFKNNYMLRRLLIAYFINGAANGLPAALFIFYVDHNLKTPGLSGVMIMIYFLSAIFATPLWLYLSRKLSKNKLWCFSMVYASLIFSTAFFLGNGDWFLFIIICILSGFALSADLAIPTSIQADLVEIETLKTNKLQTGSFFAIWSIATKGAVALSTGSALYFLSLSGFDASKEFNSNFSINFLLFMYALLPVILKSIAIFLMWSFPLSREKYISIKESLS